MIMFSQEHRSPSFQAAKELKRRKIEILCTAFIMSNFRFDPTGLALQAL
jgi:hypothetical protein